MYVERLHKEFSILDGKNISHGGIHGFSEKCRREIKENTLEAIELSVQNKIPFECDIRGTKDNIPVLAHDNEINLPDGRVLKISKMNYADIVAEAKELAPERLEDALALNHGKVPCIVDAKEAKGIIYTKYRRNLAKLLNRYARYGEIVLQSFNPIFMLVMRSHLVGVLTMQLICRAQTLLSVFSAPKSIANFYEKMVSVICFIARTDGINMENHDDQKWRFSTRAFHDDEFYDQVEEILSELNKTTDRLQYYLVKIVNELTKKPVFAFTIRKEEDFNAIESGLISNYIVDYSHLGVECYIQKMKGEEVSN